METDVTVPARPAEVALPRRRFNWNRNLLILLLGLTLGVSLVFAISMAMDASDYYSQQLSAAMPVPSGKR